MKESELNKIKKKYEIVGNCDGMNHAIKIALKIAPVDLSVLVIGENGSGKEIFSHIIHDSSKRSRKKLMAINCGAIPEGTIDSELFGHKKGAYTDALEDSKGYFGTADGGTLFLDEIGELPLGTQSRLLRVLETGEYLPVGATKVEKTDVRIVAATNVNLLEAVERGKFREDLYYRLSGITIRIPPLRERGGDIIDLFRHFALNMAQKHEIPPIRIEESAKKMLLNYNWPGNIRQLKNLAESLTILTEERVISAEILKKHPPFNTKKSLPRQLEDNIDYKNIVPILLTMYKGMSDDINKIKEALKNAGIQVDKKKELPPTKDVQEAIVEEVRDTEQKK
ncbi:sigma-54-dependent Fis family transcriptional regulator [Pseudoprevotella muciniphila]|uniref:Sigma-54-dependent Fis family transcriptional regulator n=1 Tax=Pseudoprevotella muciniphila TaxID=2133944 RepID=A0A5P8E945_9BACT|nr:sigma-54 dependent transcriptional regulator [Pseudoprevotella muciniphila]QFQ13468.1 sigma-54-dependent Fis family transcriptional regulator [Pseudoprevotella muciniphila]